MSRELQAYMAPFKIKKAKKKSVEYARYIWETHTTYGVDPFLVTALICVESGGQANARTKTCVGLMQISAQANMSWIPKRFPHIKTTKDLMKPHNNITVGAFILAEAMRSAPTVHHALYTYLGRKDKAYADKVLGIAERMHGANRR